MQWTKTKLISDWKSFWVGSILGQTQMASQIGEICSTNLEERKSAGFELDLIEEADIRRLTKEEKSWNDAMRRIPTLLSISLVKVLKNFR